MPSRWRTSCPGVSGMCRIRLEDGPPAGAGGILSFALPDIPAGATASLSYATRAGAASGIGRHRNRAVATATTARGQRLLSGVASAEVLVEAPAVFRNEGHDTRQGLPRLRQRRRPGVGGRTGRTRGFASFSTTESAPRRTGSGATPCTDSGPAPHMARIDPEAPAGRHPARPRRQPAGLRCPVSIRRRPQGRTAPCGFRSESMRRCDPARRANPRRSGSGGRLERSAAS